MYAVSVNNKTKKKSLTAMPFIWNYSCCRKSCHQMEALQCIKYILQETVADLRNHLYYLVVES